MAGDSTDPIRLFKTLARMARYQGDSDPGLAAGVSIALKHLPFFPDHFERVRGVPCTNTHLLDLAGTRTTTLLRYKTGVGLSAPRQAVRLIAIEMLERGVILNSAEDVEDLIPSTERTRS